MKHIPESITHDLARRFGLDPHHLQFLGGGQDWSDGTVWVHRNAGGDRVLKILDLALDDTEGLARAEDRLSLVGFLASHGAGIVTPLPSTSGELFSQARGDRTYLAYTYPFVPGRTLELVDPSLSSGAYYRAVGAELGRMHAAWVQHPSELRPDGSSTASRVLKGWQDEMAFFRSWCRDERVGRAWDRLRIALAHLPVSPGTYGFVHNDLHVWNLLFDPDAEPARSGGEPTFTVIDFDVANFHWFACDCATALASFDYAATGGIELPGRAADAGLVSRASEAFWEGYDRYRDTGAELQAQVDLFRQYRRCLLFMPFQEETARQPAWRDHWISRIEEEDRKLFG